MMRKHWLSIVAGWLAVSPLVSAQPINPGATVELPTYTVPAQDAEPPCDDGIKKLPTFYFNIEGLLWWTKPNNLDRPVVGSLYNSAADYSAFAGAGGLGDPNAFILGGYGRVDQGLQWGLRGCAQIMFDDMNTVGLELGGMYLPHSYETTSYNSPIPGGPALSLLFTNVTNGQPGVASALPVAGIVNGVPITGGIELDTFTELWGGDANFIQRFTQRHNPFFGDILLGYRHQGLYEGFTIRTHSLLGSTGDSYRTRNLFHGAQVGGRMGIQFGHFSLQYMGKFAVGATDQVLIQGRDWTANGFYNQPSNTWTSRSTRLGYIQESTLSLTWAIAPNVAITGGYSYLYWNRVVRPTNQIDSNINFNQVPGVLTSPVRREQRSEFWGQGANLALEVMF